MTARGGANEEGAAPRFDLRIRSSADGDLIQGTPAAFATLRDLIDGALKGRPQTITSNNLTLSIRLLGDEDG